MVFWIFFTGQELELWIRKPDPHPWLLRHPIVNIAFLQICQEKQSLKKVYFSGLGAECRGVFRIDTEGDYRGEGVYILQITKNHLNTA